MRKIDIEQGSFEWHQARWGNVTGTSLKRALDTPRVREKLMFELIAQRMTELQIIALETPAVIRGRELEEVARQEVIKSTGINFIETGLLVSPEIPRFSISPDGVYEEGGIIKGGLEIKCPSSKKHVEYLLRDEIPKEYAHQVMAPFVMSDDIEFWLFASFDDRNHERPLFIKEVKRSEYDPSYRQRLISFLKEVNKSHLKLTF